MSDTTNYSPDVLAAAEEIEDQYQEWQYEQSGVPDGVVPDEKGRRERIAKIIARCTRVGEKDKALRAIADIVPKTIKSMPNLLGYAIQQARRALDGETK